MTDRGVFGTGVVPEGEFPEDRVVDIEAEIAVILETADQSFSEEAMQILRIGYPTISPVKFSPQDPRDREYTYYLGLHPETSTAQGFLSVVLFAKQAPCNADELVQRMRWHSDREGAILLRIGDLEIAQTAVSENRGSGLYPETDLAMKDLLTVNFPGRTVSVPQERYADSGLGIAVGQ
jgi:hypothetical protein